MHVYIRCFTFLVTCSALNDPSNGKINCSLGDDEAPSYEDTCSFTCNTGYNLTGNDSGNVTTCSRGGML